MSFVVQSNFDLMLHNLGLQIAWEPFFFSQIGRHRKFMFLIFGNVRVCVCAKKKEERKTSRLSVGLNEERWMLKISPEKRTLSSILLLWTTEKKCFTISSFEFECKWDILFCCMIHIRLTFGLRKGKHLHPHRPFSITCHTKFSTNTFFWLNQSNLSLNRCFIITYFPSKKKTIVPRHVCLQPPQQWMSNAKKIEVRRGNEPNREILKDIIKTNESFSTIQTTTTATTKKRLSNRYAIEITFAKQKKKCWKAKR